MSCADVGNSKVGGRDEARATYEIYIWTPERHGSLHRNNHRMEAVRTMESTGDDSHERFVQPSLERDMPTNQKTNHSMSTLGSDQVLQLPQLLADNRKNPPRGARARVSQRNLHTETSIQHDTGRASSNIHVYVLLPSYDIDDRVSTCTLCSHFSNTVYPVKKCLTHPECTQGKLFCAREYLPTLGKVVPYSIHVFALKKKPGR